MKIQNLEGYKGNQVVNQFVINDGDDVYFQSYESLIAKKVDDEITVGKDWNYSRTTMKYLKKWFEDYCDMAGMTKENILKAIKSGKIKYDGAMK